MTMAGSLIPLLLNDIGWKRKVKSYIDVFEHHTGKDCLKCSIWKKHFDLWHYSRLLYFQIESKIILFIFQHSILLIFDPPIWIMLI